MARAVHHATAREVDGNVVDWLDQAVATRIAGRYPVAKKMVGTAQDTLGILVELDMAVREMAPAGLESAADRRPP